MSIKRISERFPGWVRTSPFSPAGYATRKEAEDRQATVIKNMQGTRGIRTIDVQIHKLSNGEFYVENNSTYESDRD